MGKPEAIRDYLIAVEEQIRWKRAKRVVSLELERHLEDQRDDFAAEGHSPEEAERLAVEDMGDPVEVGTELDRLHRPKPQWDLLAAVALGLTIWLGFRVFERMDVSAFGEYYVPYLLEMVLLAILAVGVTYFLDFTLLGRKPLTLAVLVTAAAVVPQLFRYENFLCMNLGVLLDYPHDLGVYLVLLLPLVMALAIYALRDMGTRGLTLCCVLGLLPVLPWLSLRRLDMLVPLLFCNTILLIGAVKQRWFGGKRGNWLLVVGYGLILAGLILWMAMEHGRTEYMAYNCTYAAEITKHARLIGLADISAKQQEYVQTWLRFSGYDRLLLMVLGNFGWLAFWAAQTPLLAVLFLGWRKCRRQTSVLGRLVSTAVLLTLTWQAAAYAFQNLTGLFGILTAFPYPFLSDGGAALVVDCALAGLLLSVFRSDSVVREDARGRLCGRPRHI